MNNLQEHPCVARAMRTGEPFFQRHWEAPDGDESYQQRREQELFRPQPQASADSPCDGCWRAEYCETGCESWRGYYLQRQQRINAYARAVYRGREKKEKAVFAYSHPDLVRRYEKMHPCDGCRLKKGCSIPCGRYLHWYDLRMELARKRGKALGGS